MTRIATHTFRTLAAAALAATALVASTSARAADTPGLTAGPGCSVQCLSKAVVRTTSTTAVVDLATTVPAHLTVTVVEAAPQGDGGGLAAPQQVRKATVSAFAPQKRATFAGLEPGTTYAITVRATDLKGRSSSKAGTFRTLSIQTAGLGGPSSLDTGVGCAAACIRRALLVSHPSIPGRASFEIETTVPTSVRVWLTARVPAGRKGHHVQLVRGAVAETWTTTLDRLYLGTTYDVKVEATDGQGRARVEEGVFTTPKATVRVVVHKLTVIDDADKGVNRGEIAFDYVAGDQVVAGRGHRKIGSGSTVGAVPYGTSRPGVALTFSGDHNPVVDLRVRGDECDRLPSNCLREAIEPGPWNSGGDTGGKDVSSWAVFTQDLRTVLDTYGALPPGYGTGLPAGHDAYLVWETTQYRLKFRVYATLDVELH